MSRLLQAVSQGHLPTRNLTQRVKFRVVKGSSRAPPAERAADECPASSAPGPRVGLASVSMLMTVPPTPWKPLAGMISAFVGFTIRRIHGSPREPPRLRRRYHRGAFFSVWHSELIVLRASLGLPGQLAQSIKLLWVKLQRCPRGGGCSAPCRIRQWRGCTMAPTRTSRYARRARLVMTKRCDEVPRPSHKCYLRAARRRRQCPQARP
jgi:hypothetical protein